MNMFNILFKKDSRLQQKDVDLGIKRWSAEDYGMVNEIYTDIFGNKYYILKEPTRISLKRSIAAEAALRIAEFCITKEKLKDLTDKAKEAVLSGDYSLCVNILHEIQVRSEFAGEQETLISLSTVYVYMEHEPINQYAEFWQDRKKEIWSKDQDAQDFFLDLAWRLTKQYNNLSNIDILTYLRGVKEVERKMERYFTRKS
jgi:hypothetical protein